MTTTLGYFGHGHREKGGSFLLERLHDHGPRGVSVVGLGGNRAGELRITRFLHNPHVRPREMVETAAARTAQQVTDCHILAIQDTTTLRDDGDQRGLALHPTLAVDAATGTPLGLIHAEFLRRLGGKRQTRKQRPIHRKESQRWLTATRAAGGLLAAGASRVTVVADRECDIYEEFALRPPGVELLIRAGQDRRLAAGGLLFDTLAGAPTLGRISVALPANATRTARVANLRIRTRVLSLSCPNRPLREKRKLPDAVCVTAIEACEIKPPPGVEPAHWRLLTTHKVTTLEEASQIISWYKARWTIEQLFRTMKTQGFQVEALRLQSDAPFENLAMAILIAAISIMRMTAERDGVGQRPLTDVFEPDDQPILDALSTSLEGKTARQKNPQDRKSTRLNSSHIPLSRMPSSA
mgnify:CR=1 FL=1